MEPIDFKASNKVMVAPEGREGEVLPLPVLDHGGGFVSCWRLNEQERQAIQGYPVVWLMIDSAVHPPVALSVQSPIEGADREMRTEWDEIEMDRGDLTKLRAAAIAVHEATKDLRKPLREEAIRWARMHTEGNGTG